MSISHTRVPEGPPDIVSDRMLRAVAEMVVLIRAGEGRCTSGDGVLLDVMIGDIRCVMVERASAHSGLSPREREIATMVAHGFTNRAIASALDISVWTVSTHLRRSFSKLAVSTRTELVTHLIASNELHVPESDQRHPEVQRWTTSSRT